MIVEVKIPEVGESISEGILAEWKKSDGDVVAVDEPLFELETDKVSMAIAAEAAGRLSTRAAVGSTVQVGEVVATIDTEAVAGAPLKAAVVVQPAAAATAPPAAVHEGGAPAGPDSPMSPEVRRLLRENRIEAAAVTATGGRGRLTRSDVLRHLEGHGGSSVAAVAAPAPTAPTAVSVAQPAPVARVAPVTPTPLRGPKTVQPSGERQTRRPMTRLRKRLAERLVDVKQNTAMLTTFNEADMSAVIGLRRDCKEAFKERYGVALGFMSFFVRATVEALKAVPAVGAMIDGDEIIENNYRDVGIAVSSDAGLVVPVLRDADRLTMAEVEGGVAELARRARERTLTLDDLTGGVITISNGGVFGSLLSTPILNPPQSAILGMHAIKKRPVVVDDQIVIRPMMYLALSYDHRLVDGKEAVTFLKRIVDCIERPARIFLEV